jgi:hypothetical protein
MLSMMMNGSLIEQLLKQSHSSQGFGCRLFCIRLNSLSHSFFSASPFLR